MRGLPGTPFGFAALHRVVDAATATQRWQAGAAQGQQRFVEGVQSTTKDPTALAIAQQPKLLANFTAAITSGRYARNLSKVGKAGWQSATVAKAANYSTGINASADKYQTAIGPVLQQIATLQGTVNAMPRNTIEDSAARARAFMVGLHNWAQSR